MIGFAHRGARAYAPENTLEAFALALKLGADGLESDVWLTADGVPVLDHDGSVRGRLRNLPIARVKCGDLPSHIPTFEALLCAVDARIPISIDVKDPAALPSLLEAYARVRGSVDALLHICHTDFHVLADWRGLAGDARLVHSCRLAKLRGGPERHAALLRDAGVDVVNMPYPDWTGGLVALYHRFDRLCFAWDCQHARQISEVAAMRVDAVYSDWPDRLADELNR